jgi:hypothetical protein
MGSSRHGQWRNQKFSIPGMQQILDYTKARAKLTLIFEVVDDAEDTPETRGIAKPLNVWFCFEKKNLQPTRDDFHKGTGITLVPGLTKQTAREARQFAFPTFEKNVFLYVLAEPTPEWESRYKPRIYKIPVDSGRIYNGLYRAYFCRADSSRPSEKVEGLESLNFVETRKRSEGTFGESCDG